MASAVGWGNWELADFLAPLSDPRRVALMLKKAPANKTPAARSHLERIDLMTETPQAPARAGPRL